MASFERNQQSWSRRQVLKAGGAAAVSSSIVGCELLSTDPVEESGSDTAAGANGIQAPELAERVGSAELPPVEKRLPKDPLVIEPTREVGSYGGTWQSWLHGLGSLYMLTTQIGYENLVRWDPKWSEVIPNVAESWEVRDEGEEYVFYLREGMKWSDGEPFTADDIVFAYDDVLTHSDLYGGAPEEFTVGQEVASVEKLDAYTIRVVFPAASGLFLEKLATPGRGIIVPRHYMEQFHKDYNGSAEQLAKEQGFDSWIDLFLTRNDEGQWQNPERPVLDAWVVTKPPGEGGGRAEFERNPYYWKTDTQGSQLPYLDKVSYQLIQDLEVVVLKTTNGEIDLNYPHYAATICTPANKPVLADNRDEGGYRFIDSTSSLMNQMIIALNLTSQDTSKREVFQNKDFRIGLSYAINREELIDVVFQRQGEPWQAAPRKDSELYHEELAKQYTEYDVDKANEHLDRAGYIERDGSGFRMGPDGERISVTMEVVTEMPELISSLELVKGHWKEVGVDMRVRTMDRTLFRERNAGNLHEGLVWTGDGGWGDVLLEPFWYLPFHELTYYAIPWGRWYATGGADGEEPPGAAKRQMELYDQLARTVDKDEQRELFMQILDIAQEEFWVIGTVLDEATYGTVNKTFRNVPEWMPGSWLYPSPGPTRPEQYWTSDG